MVASCLMLSNPIDASAGLQGTVEDDVERSVELLMSGSNETAAIIALFKRAALNVDASIMKAFKKLQNINEQIVEQTSTDRVLKIVKANYIFSDALDTYDGVKSGIRVARRKLRSLAIKTKNACDDMELYLEGWANEVDNGEKRLYLKEQLTIMEELMVESIALLTEAEKTYASAIDNIDGLNAKLRDFSLEIKKVVDTTSEERNTLKRNLLIADWLGCVGICSAIGKRFTKKMEELEETGESLREDVLEIKDVTRILINGLESEERIVQAWRIDAQEMDKKLDKLDLNKFQKMSLYRKVFAKSVVNLRESAEDYLKLPKEPVEIFVDDLKARRKRSLSEKTLVRKHTRNF